MTPLIDVVLVLLTLLFITLTIQTHAVKLELPCGGNWELRPPIVNLGLDFDGLFQWNAVAVDRSAMNSYFPDGSQAEPQPESHLNANKLAKYGIVAKVLADAQHVGVKKFGFTGLDQYMQ